MWTRSLAADGFFTFSMEVEEEGKTKKKFLTADGKHDLFVKGRIL